MLDDGDSILSRAAGGTLFLDEIGSLDIRTQRELLPTLTGGRSRTEPSPRVQVVAATHRDLSFMQSSGLLDREFCRNLGARIEVPPLRERPEDVLAIARQTLREKQLRLSHWGAQTLLAHSWPRNIPELEGVLRRVIHSSPANGTVDAVDLEMVMRDEVALEAVAKSD